MYVSSIPSLAVLIAGAVSGFANPGSATTLHYSAQSVTELDLFHQWTRSGGFLSTLGKPPRRATSATLNIDFAEPLAPNSQYVLSSWAFAPSGTQAIRTFSLSMNADGRRYDIASPWADDFELSLTTSATGHASSWDISWTAGGSDYFSLDGSNGEDNISWTYEYMDSPGAMTPGGWMHIQEDGFRGTTSGGQLRLASPALLGQTSLAPIPLPASGMMLLAALGLAAAMGASRKA
ncbi:MAG: hypothetical protein ACPGSW_00185 [Phaeobacter italicus]